jgi:hypothetical protein
MRIALIIIPIVIASLLLSLKCYSENNKGQESVGISEDSYSSNKLNDLRRLHEDAIFILKRYATLEALITANIQGREENSSFYIGISSLIPGTGQIINQDYLQGGLLLFASAMSWSTVNELEFTRKRQVTGQSLLPLYYSMIFAQNGLMTYSMLHAANEKYREQHNRTAAMWTGLASIIPGVGQAINKEWWAAAGFFAAWTAITVVTLSLDESIFTNGDENYLVNQNNDYDLNISCLPGGAGAILKVYW